MAARRWRPLGPLVAAAALVFGLVYLAGELGRRRAIESTVRAAEAAASLRVAVLQSEIEKQRTLPVILGKDPDVRDALVHGDQARLLALDAKLESLSAGTRTAVIYVLDATGQTIAASNWRTPTSFVGRSYAFRPYFRHAMSRGSGEHYALGTVSRQPGLYLTRRVDGPAGPLGVVVAKAEFGTLEKRWHELPETTFVTDERGIVLVTSEPEWRFRAIAPIPEDARAAIRESLQFGAASLELLPLAADPAGAEVARVRRPGDDRARRYAAAVAPIPTTGWTLHVLGATDAAVGVSVTIGRSLALLVGILAIGAAGVGLARRRRRLAERVWQETIRRELEAMVQARTAELEAANAQLRGEIDERQRAQSALHELQDELVQASKLALLGQISASVAHEINQPVAAIRTYAESGQLLLARRELPLATQNLEIITALTDRIGKITDGLRAFAHQASSRIEPVSLRNAIDGALLLVGHRLRQQAIDLDVELGDADLEVAAERIRLEQVLVNLLQNAIDALNGRRDGRIRIAGVSAADSVAITISDNGPGVPAELMGSSFMPFKSTKPNGLGLGLVICSDIVTSFRGTFVAENSGGGAQFRITLPRPS